VLKNIHTAGGAQFHVEAIHKVLVAAAAAAATNLVFIIIPNNPAQNL
jgi:hypothetical protein